MSKTIDLRPPKHNLRTVPIGTTVITSKGFKFKLISRKKSKESWKDVSSKVIWHDMEVGSYNYYRAVEKFGNFLPTIEEFIEAEKHGFREVLPNMAHCFWSSSPSPYNSVYAQFFSGYFGVSYYGYNRYYYVSVRCVGR